MSDPEAATAVAEMLRGAIVAGLLALGLLLLLAAVAAAEYVLYHALRAAFARSRSGSAPTPVLRDADAAAAVSEAIRIVATAAQATRARPRCWRCRERMARDTGGTFWHCTSAGCPGSLLSVNSTLPWEQEP